MTEKELFNQWFSNYENNIEYAARGIAWDAWQAATQREGFRFVPTTANKRMLKAGYDAHNDFFFDGQVQDVYKAMIGVIDDH